eukprot:scaffold200095_cov43-Prasinocladus_malaysianus.AAC.1
MEHQSEAAVVFFTDVDEFIVLCDHVLISEFLQEHMPSHGQSKCMHFRWLNFGTSHNEVHPPGGSVLANYRWRGEAHGKGNPGGIGKVALSLPLKLRDGFKSTQIHHSCSEYDIDPSQELEVPTTTAKLHHYWLRGGTKDAFALRLGRGSAGDWFYQSMYSTRSV